MYDSDCGPKENNYADYFHTLLYLDEYMAIQSMENYNMTNVPLQIMSEKRFQLQVGHGTSCLTILSAFIRHLVLGKWSHSATGAVIW
jgi:hypothetical protein